MGIEAEQERTAGLVETGAAGLRSVSLDAVRALSSSAQGFGELLAQIGRDLEAGLDVSGDLDLLADLDAELVVPLRRYVLAHSASGRALESLDRIGAGQSETVVPAAPVVDAVPEQAQSGGVDFSKALRHEPSVIITDEPDTNVGDGDESATEKAAEPAFTEEELAGAAAIKREMRARTRVEVIAAALRQFDAGFDSGEVAETHEVSRTTVNRWVRTRAALTGEGDSGTEADGAPDGLEAQDEPAEVLDEPSDPSAQAVDEVEDTEPGLVVDPY